MLMLRNAFIIDYIAEYVKDGGCTSGMISSYDGYTRTLSSQQSFNIDIYDKQEDGIFVAGTTSATGEVSAIKFRDYYLRSTDYGYKYGYSDGATATYYIDPADGYYRSSINDLTVYAVGMSCAELMLNVYPIYVCSEFDGAALSDLKTSKSIYSIYCSGTDIVYNDPSLSITPYAYYEYTYSARYEN